MINPHDNQYSRLLDIVLSQGRWKNNRTGIRTLGVFGAQAKFDLNEGFPLLTTKKVFFRGIVHELLWFIKGDTNIKYLVDNNVHIWDEWAYKRYVDVCKVNDSVEGDKWMRYFKGNVRVATIAEADNVSMYPQDEFIEKIKNDDEFAQRWGGLGEGTYGGMWRGFPFEVEGDRVEKEGVTYVKTNGFGRVDQLKNVVDKLKTNPDDRRLIVSAWHPYFVDHCVLPPCHCLYHFHTEELTLEERTELGKIHCQSKGLKGWFNGHVQLDEANIPKRRLNCLLYQRSCDLFLGVPFNIASYALLTHMIAKVCNMEVGVFTHTYGDLHIYENHMEQVRLQRSMDSFIAPTIKLANKTDLFDFKFEDIELVNYKSQAAIKGEVAV